MSMSLQVRIMSTLSEKDRIKEDSLKPKASFVIDHYEKSPTWMYFDQHWADTTLYVHDFLVTFKSKAAARRYAKENGSKLRNSHWDRKFHPECPYCIHIGPNKKEGEET